MRRIGDRGIDLVTLVHQLVGAVWRVSAIVILVRVWTARAATPPAVVAWNRVETFARLGLLASAATFVLPRHPSVRWKKSMTASHAWRPCGASRS